MRSRRPLLLPASFAVYLALLVWIVLWKLEVPYVDAGAGHIKVVPFAATPLDSANAPLEVLVNLLLFVPFGAYLGLLAPRWSWLRIGGAAALLSLALEVAQYVLAVGVSDTTDLIVNTAGAVLGFALLALLRRSLGARATRAMTRACAIATGAMLVASVAFFASPIHYLQRNVHPPLLEQSHRGETR